MSRFNTIKQRLRAGLRAFAGINELVAVTPSPLPPPPPSPPPAVLPTHSRILDYYLTTAPDPQQTLDLFKDEWSSQLPEPYNHLRAGTVGLFNDVRITWAFTQFGDLHGMSALELGSLDGGHAYMLEQAGAAEVIAIEANSRAFLRCLIVKELLKLQRVQFLCGDFVAYLRTAPRRFDLIIASGVLYHMRNPAELIALLAQTSDRIYVWTHYYDEAIIKASPVLAPKFPSSTPTEYGGFAHQLYRQEYQVALALSTFCGGTAEHSAWMSRADLFACVRYFGFTAIEVAFEVPEHPNGPCLAFVATR